MKLKHLFFILCFVLASQVNSQNFFRNSINYSSGTRQPLGFNYKQGLGGIYAHSREMVGHTPSRGELVRFNDNGDTLWTKRIKNQGQISDWYDYYPINECILKTNGTVIQASAFRSLSDMYKGHYYLFRYNNSGTLLSKDSIFLGMGWGWGKAIVDIQSSNDYYVMYTADSLWLPYVKSTRCTHIERRDVNNNVVWTRRYSTNLPTWWSVDSLYWIFDAKADVSGNLYVHMRNPDNSRQFQRITPSGNLSYTLNPAEAIPVPPGKTGKFQEYFPFNDGGVLLVQSFANQNNPAVTEKTYFVKLDPSGSITDSLAIDSINARSVVISGNRIYVQCHQTLGGIPASLYLVLDLNLNIIGNYPFNTFPPSAYIGNYSFLEPNNSGGMAGVSMNYTPYKNGFRTDCVFSFDSLFNLYPNVVTGKSILDLDNNCTLNNGDIRLKNRIIQAADINNNAYYAITDSAGQYSLNVPNGNFNLSENVFQNKFSKCPVNNQYPLSIAPPVTNYSLTFYDTIVPNINDVKNVSYLDHVFAGELSYYSNVIMNNGSNTVNSVLKIVKDTALTYVSSDVAPLSMNADTLYFSINGLAMDSVKLINIQFMVSENITESHTIVCHSHVPLLNDLTPLNNYDTLYVQGASYLQKQQLKTNEEAKSILGVSEPVNYNGVSELVYKLNYKNTTGQVIKKLYITDTIDQKLDLGSLKILKTPARRYSAQLLNGRILQFKFDNMNISNGESVDLVFSLMPSGGMLGDTIKNRIGIYDEYAVVSTNQTWNIFKQNVVGIKEVEKKDTDIKLFPNPSNGTMYIQSAAGNVKGYRIYDLVGREVRSDHTQQGEMITISEQELKGLFIIQIDTEKKSYFKKVILE